MFWADPQKYQTLVQEKISLILRSQQEYDHEINWPRKAHVMHARGNTLIPASHEYPTTVVTGHALQTIITSECAHLTGAVYLLL